MRKLLLTATLLLSSIQAFPGTTIQPTTTLAAETGNNTSGANTFKGLPNGNLGAGNVSKAPIRSLLYSGSTTRIYVHLMPWFGVTEKGYREHVEVGYESADPDQAARQVADMVSRGIDGAIIDWYGKLKTHHNTASLNVLKAAEEYANFEVALTEDVGAVKNAADPTQKTIDDLTYAWTAFMQSPAYMRRQGRPVVFFFGFDGSGVDIAKVKASVPGNPLFIFRNSGAFSATGSDGAFGWLAPKTTDYENYMSLGYLDNFYSTALRYPTQLTFGSGFKGFNDTVASWSPPGGRHIPQMCGQTWLRSMAEAGKYYSSTKQLENLQLVTWNDYEEGSALETGIDNCVTVSANIADGTLKWNIAGEESTLEQFTIFISTDGQNLMPLGFVPASMRAYEIKQFDLAPGSYKLYVKAVGKPSMRNQMSSAVTYSVVAPPPPPQPSPDWKITVGPSPTTMSKTGTANLSVGLQPTTTAYNSAVSLACKDLPPGMQCKFSTGSVTPGSGASVTLTLSSTQNLSSGGGTNSMLFAMSMFGVIGICSAGSVRRRARWLFMMAGIAGVLVLAGCGAGGGSTKPPEPPQTTVLKPGAYTISVVGTSGATVKTASATVIVQ